VPVGRRALHRQELGIQVRQLAHRPPLLAAAPGGGLTPSERVLPRASPGEPRAVAQRASASTAVSGCR
jgi:hypothetical protein